MNTYSFPFSSFTHGVNLDLLGREVVDALPKIVPAYLGANLDETVDLLFDAALSISEEMLLGDVVNLHDPTDYSFKANYHQDFYSQSRRLISTTWFAYKTSTNELLYKFIETIYTYNADKSALMSEKLSTYDSLGRVIKERTFTYQTVTEPDGTIYIRKSES